MPPNSKQREIAVLRQPVRLQVDKIQAKLKLLMDRKEVAEAASFERSLRVIEKQI